MPSIKDQSTVEAIAREFCNNGRNKAEALRTIGYKDSYCDNHGTGIVYTTDRMKKAIKRIDDEIRDKFDWDREQNLIHHKRQIQRYEVILKDNPNNLQAMQGLNQVLRELNASSNQHSSTLITKDDEQVKELAASERDEAQRLANIRLRTG